MPDTVDKPCPLCDHVHEAWITCLGHAKNEYTKRTGLDYYTGERVSKPEPQDAELIRRD